MNQYVAQFVNNIREQLKRWKTEQSVSREELLRFLHSAARTATIIGGDDIEEKARQLFNELKEQLQQKWTVDEVASYIFPVMKLCYVKEEEPFAVAGIAEETSSGDAPTIWLVGDDILFFMYIKEGLKQVGWQVAEVPQIEKALSFVYEEPPDCMVIDVCEKELQNLHLLQLLENAQKQLFIPIVMISDDHRKEMRLKSYQLGANDFIAKPFAIDELIVRMYRLWKKKKRIDQLVLVDELTQVYNRKYLKKAYESLSSDLERFHELSCIAMLDLDHFKQINDRFGHLVGDIVLQEFARFLCRKTRIGDTVVRFGGEEFIVLLPKTAVGDALRVVERLRNDFSTHLIETEGRQISCTFSGGIVEINDPSKPLEYWLELVDQALYAAKQQGGNCITVAKPADERC
ncbi:GGDEF domain-containing response regulator [Saccharococcus thermophilus]|uniref:Diguanylate cyclase (GGDEF)-like protein n=1 Tax=Saccharococcus thermophilus TaxID=29396 RepID=A0A846MJX2_9BACL|nr:GGDEF domain-containing response regulator [Saccharococcus thermophilus]NIK15959.1 diguanylate cyclase (GGDEF)-like protein [Saccharococcus thermophilus]